MKEGIYLRDLNEGDVITLETKSHIYTLKILDPKVDLVEMTSNGPHIDRPTVCQLCGSCPESYDNILELALNPSLIKYGKRGGWLGVGYRAFFMPILYLSATRSITVNGVKVLPKD